MQTSLFNTINMPDFKKVNFEKFYSAYPRKVGRYTAEKSFKKLSTKDRQDAYNGLINYCKFWKANETEKQFIPHPSTFINQKRWEDEIELPKEKVVWELDSTGRFYKGYCQKCRSFESYTETERNGDSRCCKARILPKRK